MNRLNILRSPVLAIILAWLFFAGPAFSAPFFQSISLEEAKKLAVEKKRVICVYCNFSDSKNNILGRFEDIQVEAIGYLKSRAIGVYIDPKKDRDFAERYFINTFPTLLLLKVDGSEMDRYWGLGLFRRDVLLKVTKDTFAGKDSVQKLRDQLAKAGPDNPAMRFELATHLMHRGQFQEALAEFLWCFDDGKNADLTFEDTLIYQLPNIVARLGRSYPPALEELKKRRDALSAYLAKLPASVGGYAVDLLLMMNLALHDESAIVEGVVKYSKQSGQHQQALSMLVPFCMGKKHYQEVLALIPSEQDLIDALNDGADKAKLLKSRGGLISLRLRSDLMRYIEVQAGVGHEDKATEMSDRILKLQDDAQTRVLIGKSFLRAGSVALARKYDPGMKTETQPAPKPEHDDASTEKE